MENALRYFIANINRYFFNDSYQKYELDVVNTRVYYEKVLNRFYEIVG